jgi:flagellar protein FliS
MFSPVSMRLVNSYKSVGLETSVAQASTHQLVGMLFDGLLQSLKATKSHIESGNFADKGRSVNRAVRILEEGLKAALDLKNGGELASNLLALYDFCIFKLTEANLRNNAGMVDEVIQAVQPVADSWSEIRSEVTELQRAA